MSARTQAALSRDDNYVGETQTWPSDDLQCEAIASSAAERYTEKKILSEEEKTRRDGMSLAQSQTHKGTDSNRLEEETETRG